MNKTNQSQPIYIDSFDYPLPDERIAKFPLPRRDDSKLLLYRNGAISESKFSNIASFLPADSLLVYNNTRVIQARLVFRKSTGARIEVFCLEPLVPSDYALSLGSTACCEWKCMVGNLKKWKEGELTKLLTIGDEHFVFKAQLMHTEGNTHTIRFSWEQTHVCFADILDNAGELPIPPYLHRQTAESDLTTYQTVYSKTKGSVAAPTAGLHFTPEVFTSLKAKNISTDELTLHVGAGTFQPVKTPTIDEHTMHAEVISVQRATIYNLQQNLGSIIAVGTTSVRTMESLYYIGVNLGASGGKEVAPEAFYVSQWAPYLDFVEIETSQALQNILDYLDNNHLTTLHAQTQIMIKPGYQFRLVNGIITNFHQPKSTLLLLVSAFVDGNWEAIYDYALKNDFRFLSYGDSSLLMK